MGKKHPCYGKSMSINFPDFSHTMGFVAFSRTVGNLQVNPCKNVYNLWNFHQSPNNKKNAVKVGLLKQFHTAGFSHGIFL